MLADKLFLQHLFRLVNDKGQVRIQKSVYLQEIKGETFTVSIERGDKLNKPGQKKLVAKES